MVRFFFDFDDGAYTTHDKDGHECESVNAAWIEVLSTLPEIIIGNPQSLKERHISCFVRNLTGDTVFTVSFTLKSNIN